MPDLDDLLAQLDRSADEIMSVHRDLVSIPSVNTGFMPTGNETPVCEYARDLLARDGISAEILESAPGRGNLLSGLEGASGRPGLMFMSHTDVVPVGDESKWRFPPFNPHSVGQPRLWAGRIRLQGPAHRPADGDASAEAQRRGAS